MTDMVADVRPRYAQQTVSGNGYYVTNQTPVSTTAALATTFTGLAIGNPTGSGFNLLLTKVLVSQAAAGVAGAVGIMGGTGSITASITPSPRLLGVASPVAQAHATAGQTISTPVLIATLGSLGSVATTAYGLNDGLMMDFEGSIVVPPGAFIASYTTAATTTALIFTFFWEEVPIGQL